jgi:hypothetical protein
MLVNAPGTQSITNAMPDPLMSLEELLTVRQLARLAVVTLMQVSG